MNQFNGIGRLTKDPDVRYSEDGKAFARYTIAIDRPYSKEKEADFLPCICFGKTAEFAEKYLKKGIKIGITGRVQIGSYKNRDGNTVYTTDIVVNEHTFCERRQEPQEAQQEPPEAPKDGFLNIPSDIDERLPFH